MMTKRRAGVVGLVGLAGLAMAASVAWACTAISGVYSIAPAAAPPGTTVMVTGHDFWPREVQIRWNSIDGRVLATTNGPEVEAGVTIPDVAPGHYSVYITQDGSLNPYTTFEVTAPDSPATTKPDDPSAVTESGSGFDDSQSYQPVTGSQASADNDQGATQPTTGRRSTAATARPPTTPRSPAPAATPTATSQGGPAQVAALAQPQPQVSEPAPVPRRSASGEVSFASPWKSGPGGAGDSLGHATADGRAGSGMGAGVALMGLGLAGLAGAATVGLRRRSVLEAASNHDKAAL